MIPTKRGDAPGGKGQQGGGDSGHEREDKPRGGQGGQGQQVPEVEPNKEEGDMEKEDGGEENRDKLT